MTDARKSSNMLDPAEQERIRRTSHEYIPLDGKHGIYKEKKYVHQEFPKMLGKWPKPEYRQFLAEGVPPVEAQSRFEQALQEWSAAMEASIVQNKAEESNWLKQNG